MSDPNCRACRFWVEDMELAEKGTSWGFGQCRRQPPQIVSAIAGAMMTPPQYGRQIDPDLDTVDVATATLFPVTHSSDWCGQFDDHVSGVPL